MTGLEPETFPLPRECSTNWATLALLFCDSYCFVFTQFWTKTKKTIIIKCFANQSVTVTTFFFLLLEQPRRREGKRRQEKRRGAVQRREDKRREDKRREDKRREQKRRQEKRRQEKRTEEKTREENRREEVFFWRIQRIEEKRGCSAVQKREEKIGTSITCKVGCLLAFVNYLCFELLEKSLFCCCWTPEQNNSSIHN